MVLCSDAADMELGFRFQSQAMVHDAVRASHLMHPTFQ